MKQDKLIGILLIAGAIGVFIPYSILTVTFNYPDVLRDDPGKILLSFHAGGPALICTWLAFALLGLPLIVAYSLIGQQLEGKLSYVRWATTIGIISGIAQVTGLLRWVFVVPVLANDYLTATSMASKEAIVVAFKMVHQFGGVLLGEHIGQLFTIVWTVLISAALLKLRRVPAAVAYLGFVSAGIYLLAQSALLATVIPGFPVIDIAGLVGSTLWLIWLVATGVKFILPSKRSAALTL